MLEYKTETFTSIYDTKRSLRRNAILFLKIVVMKAGNLLTFSVLVLSMMILVFKRAQ